jgi:hypothetical protein
VESREKKRVFFLSYLDDELLVVQLRVTRDFKLSFILMS